MANAENSLEIADLKSWTLREPVSKRRYSVVKIQTKSGLHGFGESAPLAPAEIAGAKQAILGRDATSFETTAPLLADFPTARAALNIAMLDVVGKAAQAPIFQILGGPTRHKARALVAIAGDSDATLVRSMQRCHAAGFRAFMVPAPSAANANQGQAYVFAVKRRLETLPRGAGPDCDFVLDGNSQLAPGDAQMIGAAIERLHVLWFNEPCDLTNLSALKKLAGESVTPIGIGSGIREPNAIQDLLREDAVDIIRPDIGQNGISQIRRMAAIAENYYVAVGPTHDGGPIGTAAALHLAAAIPNFFIQQIPWPEADEDRRMRLDLTTAPVERIKDGFAELPTGPGLGITVNERALERYAEAAPMKRRDFFAAATGAFAATRVFDAHPAFAANCPCDEQSAGQSTTTAAEATSAPPTPWQRGEFDHVLSKVRITNVKPIGVTYDPASDRPYVFVKLETNAGLVGWGEATLEGKAGAVIACVNDFRDFLIGSDPVQVEHHWQSMYVHSFYRAGPVMGSAISGIDQALWDLRGKILGLPVYKLLGGPVDPRGVRGYYHARARTREDLQRLRETAVRDGVTCFKTGPAVPTFEWIETHAKIDQVIRQLTQLRDSLGPDIDIGVDFHAKTSPSVAAVILKEIEPLNLLFVEEMCPPENVKAMARIARRTTTPIATGERLITHYGCRELIEQGVVDILQPDINHAGGITALWKIAAMAAASGITMAPHNCEGPIGGLATVAVDAAMTNFLVQEVCSGVQPDAKEKIWEEWLGFPAMRMVNGRFPLLDKPGLGFDLTEDALKKYPFTGTRLMARVFHPDGSVAEW